MSNNNGVWAAESVDRIMYDPALGERRYPSQAERRRAAAIWRERERRRLERKLAADEERASRYNPYGRRAFYGHGDDE